VVTTIRTSWIHDINRADDDPDSPGDPANQPAQYRNVMLNLKRFLAGEQPLDSTGAWTVLNSSNGDGVSAVAGDNWADTGDIVFDLAGNNHSWAELRSPANIVPGGDGYMYIVIDCINTAADANPDQYDCWLSPIPFTLAVGTQTDRPTSSIQTKLAQDAWLPATFNPVTSHGWRNEVGEFYFFVSQDGTGLAGSFIMAIRPDNGSGTAYPLLVGRDGWDLGLPAGAVDTGDLNNPGTWEGWGNNGSTVLTAMAMQGIFVQASSWTNGQDAVSANLFDGPIDFLANGISPQGFYMGRVVDVRGASNGTTGGTSQAPQDSDPIVRKSIGCLWLPTPTGTPINL
jgi:hypothetical protein